MAKFWHSTSARNDIRLIKLSNDYGSKAIGIYWMMVELVYKATSEGKKWKLSTLCEIIGGTSRNTDYIIAYRILTKYNLFTMTDDGYVMFDETGKSQLHKSVEQ